MNIAECWQVIEDELRVISPVVFATLRAGATEAELAQLEEFIGQSLPEDFRKSLRIHNGQEDPSRLLGMIDYNRLEGTKEIISDYEMHRDLFLDEPPFDWMEPGKILNYTWHPGWIKFSEFESDGYVMDLAPGPLGARGQVFYRPHDDMPSEIIAPSFEGFLNRIADGLRNVEYEMDEFGSIRFRWRFSGASW